MPVHDINNWLRFPYGKKPLADSTLRSKTKAELIQIIRDYEHNYAVLYEAHERGVAYAQTRLKALEEKFGENESRIDSLLKTVRDMRR